MLKLYSSLLFLCLSAFCFAQKKNKGELVYMDKQGTIRWTSNQKEIGLFGANYCLPSACDYRAAGAVGADRKLLVEQDMAHFARMGWDALRLSFWGDWENCDKTGNLINNDHLDIMDYVVAQASKRGIYMLLSPIVTYTSQWPDKMEDTTQTGFSKYYKKSELGTNPQAIAAQVNYVKQIMLHRNPYTGNLMKDEPNILFVEPINEPHHHPENLKQSVEYINALAEAVRSTGCKKLLFHNLTENMDMIPSIEKSTMDGFSIGWYPTGLVYGKELKGNMLRTIDHYYDLNLPSLSKKARIVYEFDMPDVLTGYHYPAMARSFKEIGVQFATIFSYDMLATAPYNLGWQTHCINMVYTPKKAVASIIAAEAMKRLPRFKNFGEYPQNTTFGDFSVSYEKDESELNTPDCFMYSNNTNTQALSVQSLKKIVGFGSSPLVGYEGKGVYFLDKIEDGVWRLEIYPDAVQVEDPFEKPRKDKIVTRLIRHPWAMQIKLPDLGQGFSFKTIHDNKTVAAHSGKATKGTFEAQPGVYLLTAEGQSIKDIAKDQIGFVKTKEFVCPPVQEGELRVVASSKNEQFENEKIQFKIQIIDSVFPESIEVNLRASGQGFYKSFPMNRTSAYSYLCELPENTLTEGSYEYFISIKTKKGSVSYPGYSKQASSEWNFDAQKHLPLKVNAPTSALTLFQAEKDLSGLMFSRSAENWKLGSLLHQGSQAGSMALRFGMPTATTSFPSDLTCSSFIGDKIQCHATGIEKLQTIKIRLRTTGATINMKLCLVEKDGTAWAAQVKAEKDWKDVSLPINSFQKSNSVMLPQGYPGNWAYWMESPKGRDKMDASAFEKLQFSLQANSFNKGADLGTQVEIESVTME